MCCLFTTLIVLGPRAGFLVWWLLQPDRINAAFNAILWPILGVIFLPWTTIVYVLVSPTPGGVVGLDWLWLTLAALCDLGSYAGGAYGNRDRIPGY